MLELTSRGYRESDAPALSALINVIEEQGGGHAGFAPAFIDSLVRSMVREPATDSRLLFNPEDELVAAGLVSTPPDGASRIDLMGGVDPRWRGRGIGRELLGWELSRAADIHRTVAPAAAWEIHIGAPGADKAAAGLYARFGMTPVRYWFDMVAPTVSAPTVSAPTVTVPVAELPGQLRGTPYRSAYEESAYEAYIEAFADSWGFQHREYEEWVARTVRSESFLPELSALAFDGGEIAGFVLSYEDADPAGLYIGQVGVRRPWRRRGLAGALLGQVLAAARAVGKDFAALGVDADSPTGAVGVYERVGFTVVARSVTYSRPLAL